MPIDFSVYISKLSLLTSADPGDSAKAKQSV